MTTFASDNQALDELLDIVSRLSQEFTTVGIGVLTSVIVDCRRDLSGVPPTALPELVERLARVRLNEALGA